MFCSIFLYTISKFYKFHNFTKYQLSVQSGLMPRKHPLQAARGRPTAAAPVNALHATKDRVSCCKERRCSQLTTSFNVNLALKTDPRCPRHTAAAFVRKKKVQVQFSHHE